MDFDKNSWCILSPIEQSIKRKIEAVGVPLKDWNISINYGIKTDCNEAFIIDGATKDALIAQDPKSAEIIRPILRGRDIKRYSYEFADKWLIATFPSRHYNIDDYPAVKNYLLSFGKEKLEQSGKKDIGGIKGNNARKKTNNKWFETQDTIAYWDYFSKQKIVWKRIGSIIRFAIDEKGVCPLDSVCFLTGNENLKYIVGYLNSSFAIKQLLDNAPKTGTGDVIISVQALEPLLIPKCDDLMREKVEKLVDVIIENKSSQHVGHQIDLIFKQILNLSSDEVI